MNEWMNAGCTKSTNVLQHHRPFIHSFSKNFLRSCFYVQSIIPNTMEICTNYNVINNYNHTTIANIYWILTRRQALSCFMSIHLILTTTLWDKHTIIIISTYKGKNLISERLSKWKQVGDMCLHSKVGKVQEPSGMS